MTPGISEVLGKSVTLGDAGQANGVIQFMLPYGSMFGGDAILPQTLPSYWSKDRDKVLLQTIDAESMWASAVAIACTKMASAAWEIEGEIPLRVKTSQDILQMADLQRGWVPFLGKHLQSYLLTDNGAFIEIVRATTSLNSKIIGLVHLDSTRCTRTGDAEIPVVYQDRQGRLHELKRHEVMDISDMPDSRELFFGVGHCAASRAYSQIIKLAAVETYIYEKITGRRIKEVHFVSGVNDKQVSNFVAAAEHQADAKGLIAYMGAVIVPVPGDKQAAVSSIPLAGFPDGFDREKETNHAILVYADSIGLDVQDLQPLTGRPMGTSGQSEILSDKAAGKGMAAWRQAFIHNLNFWVIPDLTTMLFIEKDWRDKNSEATYNKTTSEYVAASVTATVLTPQQGLQALVDAHVYPKEFLPVDQTPNTSLTDTEKPEEGEAVQDEAAAPVENPIVQVPAVKDYVEDLIVDTKNEAKTLVQRIRAKLKPAKKVAAEIIEPVAGDTYNDIEDSITVSIPVGLLRQKEAPPNIVVNVPAPIVNVAAPIVNIPQAAAPIVNVTAPPVTLNPNIQINMPERKPREFTVRRDNYGNVLGIEQKGADAEEIKGDTQ
jgi:hypothetical protein